jgi:multicomponent K+:H+ antiporter subunit D
VRTTDVIILPVVLPLFVGALLLLLDERRHALKAAISLASSAAVLAMSIALLRLSDTPGDGQEGIAPAAVYLLGNWPAPFGIVLIADRLASLMLVLTSVLAFAALLFSLARWHRAGAHFHSLFQFLLMGLNGAFLTGDVFNLFVFFEVLLAASYGLVLHGSGRARVGAGLHYIAVNLAASSLFLIGVSLIYGATGTLSMADITIRVPALNESDRTLLEAGAAILGIAFLAKAGMWPLSFWLPNTYAVAAPPVAAFFVIMSKVGVYVVLRLWLLAFGDDAGASAQFGGAGLMVGGMMTIIFGSIGVLASQDLARLASFNVLISSGTLLAAIAVADVAVTGGALFYLVNSTLAIGAFFLLIELIERGRAPGADVLAVTMEAFGEADEDTWDRGDVGVVIPVRMAVLGVAFVCCALLLAGQPPLSGFVAKFLLLAALFRPPGIAAAVPPGPAAWALMALLLLSGLATVIAMARAGIRTFWLPLDSALPRVRLVEITPIVVLLLLCTLLTVQARPVLRLMEDTAQSLHFPQGYIRDVMSAPRAQRASNGARP